MSFIPDYAVILNDRVKRIYPVVSSTIPEEYTKYTNKVTHNQYQYTMQGVTGLAMGQVITDGQIPASDAPIQGYLKSFTQAIFTHRVRISKAAFYYLFQAKDGAKIDSMVEKEILNLKGAVTTLKNYYAQSLLANGWATSFSFTPLGGLTGAITVDTTGADGVAYWSASHPREDGGTAWSNIIVSSASVVNPPFTFANLLQARSLHYLKKDGRGLPLIGSTLDTLLLLDGSASYHLAMTIQGTLTSGKYPGATPGTTSSFVDANPTSSFKIVGLANYGGTGATSLMWFMFDSTKVTDDFGFQFIESMTPTMTPFEPDYVGNMDFISTITTYCQFGANDLRYWEASNGTSA